MLLISCPLPVRSTLRYGRKQGKWTSELQVRGCHYVFLAAYLLHVDVNVEKIKQKNKVPLNLPSLPIWKHYINRSMLCECGRYYYPEAVWKTNRQKLFSFFHLCSKSLTSAALKIYRQENCLNWMYGRGGWKFRTVLVLVLIFSLLCIWYCLWS